jgi:hypothetical protein
VRLLLTRAAALDTQPPAMAPSQADVSAISEMSNRALKASAQGHRARAAELYGRAVEVASRVLAAEQDSVIIAHL